MGRTSGLEAAPPSKSRPPLCRSCWQEYWCRVPACLEGVGFAEVEEGFGYLRAHLGLAPAAFFAGLWDCLRLKLAVALATDLICCLFSPLPGPPARPERATEVAVRGYWLLCLWKSGTTADYQVWTLSVGHWGHLGLGTRSSQAISAQTARSSGM